MDQMGCTYGPNGELKKYQKISIVTGLSDSIDDHNGRHDRVHTSLQRSKSDVRHETRAASLQQQTTRRGSNFELAFLLERGRTLDAKLFGTGDWNDKDQTLKRVEGSFGYVATDSGRKTLFLPIRFKQALVKRRFSSSSVCSRFFPPRTSLSCSLQGSTLVVSGPLDCLPEIQQFESQIKVDANTADQIFKDIEATIPWLQQEIRSLKQQDRKLFRQLLDLGTEIHKMSGMESCQSYSASLDMDEISASPQSDIHNISNTLIDRNNSDDSTPVHLSVANNDDHKFKDRKLIDICTSFESFFI